MERKKWKRIDSKPIYVYYVVSPTSMEKKNAHDTIHDDFTVNFVRFC